MKKIVFTMCSVSTLAFAAPVYGQVTERSEVVESDAIIVTARRREESAQDVPLTLNTVTAEDVSKLNLQDAKDIQALVPGLELRTEANGIGGNGQVRGVQYDVNSGAEPTVEFYVNDAPVSGAIILAQLYDIGQIEVLRGPQGTLRGRASPSGSITFTTKKPDLQEYGGTFSMSLSDIGTTNLNGAIGLPLIKDVLAIRVAGVWDDNNSNRVRSIDPDADRIDPRNRTKSGRVSALFKPTDWLKFEGMWQRNERDAINFDQYASADLRDPTVPASAVLINPKDRLSIQETAQTVDQTSEILNGRVEARMAGQILIYQFQQSKLEVDSTTNLDPANLIDGFDHFQSTHSWSKATSHELRLQNEDRVFGMFDYVVGLFHSKLNPPTDLVRRTPVYFPSFIPSPPFPDYLVPLAGTLATIAETDIFTGDKRKEQSIFGNVTAHIGDATQVSAGLRYIDFEKPQGLLFINGAPIVTAGPVDDESIIYTASIQHNFTRDLMVYASTGTSRRPGPSIVGVFSPVRSDLLNSFIELGAEKSESYEVGLKSSWLNDRLIFNLTGYYQKFKNYPYKLQTPIFFVDYVDTDLDGTFDPAVGSSPQMGAAVPVTVKGVEAELTFKATPNLNVGLVASYVDGKIKNGVIPCNDLNGDGVPDANPGTPTLADLQAAYGTDLVGACRVTQRSSFQAPFSATAHAEYSFPVSGTMDAFARGLLTYRGKSQGDPTNSIDDESGYGIVNLYAGLRDPDGGWEINLFAKNVFDTVRTTKFNSPAVTSYQELTLASGLLATEGKAFGSTYSIIETTPPREFGINVRIAFGSH